MLHNIWQIKMSNLSEVIKIIAFDSISMERFYNIYLYIIIMIIIITSPLSLSFHSELSHSTVVKVTQLVCE